MILNLLFMGDLLYWFATGFSYHTTIILSSNLISVPSQDTDQTLIDRITEPKRFGGKRTTRATSGRQSCTGEASPASAVPLPHPHGAPPRTCRRQISLPATHVDAVRSPPPSRQPRLPTVRRCGHVDVRKGVLRTERAVEIPDGSWAVGPRIGIRARRLVMRDRTFCRF